MSFPATLLLGLFSIVFFGIVVMALVHIFHAWQFGAHSRQTILTSSIFLLGIGVIVAVMIGLLLPVDWNQSFDVTIPNVQLSAPQDLNL